MSAEEVKEKSSQHFELHDPNLRHPLKLYLYSNVKSVRRNVSFTAKKTVSCQLMKINHYSRFLLI